MGSARINRAFVTPEVAAKVKELLALRITQKNIAGRLGVSMKVIGEISTGRKWK